MQPGSSYNSVFKVTKTEPGTYTVGIGDLSEKYTVQKPVETIQVTAAHSGSPRAYIALAEVIGVMLRWWRYMPIEKWPFKDIN